MQPFHVSLRTEVSGEAIAQFLGSALNGGSHYWIEACDAVGDDAEHFEGYREDALNVGLELDFVVCDPDDDEIPRRTIRLTREKAALACQLYAEKHPATFARCINELGYIDAESGDTWLQFALLGDELYG